MKISIGLLVLCVLSVLGAWVSKFFGIPIPGAILALLALAAYCVYRGKSHHSLDRASQTLTLLLPLFIMPSSIGIMDNWDLIKQEWLAITVAIFGSVLFTLITTPVLIKKLENQKDVSREGGAS